MSEVTTLYWNPPSPFAIAPPPMPFQAVTAGKYTTQDLLLNDAVSAISVPDGWRVTLYADDNFGGAFKTYYGGSSIQDLSATGFSGKTSSLVMEPACVILYADEGFNGTRQLLTQPGRYDMASLATVGNDKITSLRVPPGWKVTLHQHDDFAGSSVSFTADTSNVGKFNDMTSSITVTIDKVIAYTDPGFTGNSQIFDVGNFPLSRIKIGNDTISSVRVPPGWKVTMYGDDFYAGSNVTYYQDVSSFQTLDNAVSSIRVAKLTDSFQPTSGQYYVMQCADNGLAADVSGASTAQGANVIAYTRHNGANQQFRFEPAPDGFYYVRARHSGLVVGVQNGATASGTILVQQTAAQAKYQQWRFEPLANGYAISARNSRLTMTSGSLASALTQTQRTGINQTFQMVALEDPLPPGTSGVPASPPTVGRTGTPASTGTATSTPSTTTSTPAAISNLGSITVSIFFYQFSFPLSFGGDITITPMSKAITYSGAASLPAPFNVSVNPLAVSLSASDGTDWMLKFGLPQSTTISSIIQNNVLSLLPSSTASTIQSLILPFLNIYNNSVVILSKNDGDDADYGSYLGGFNVYTSLKASQIPPFDLLHRTFSSLGLDSRDVVLGVGASSGAEQNFFVNAQLGLNVPLVPSQPSLAVLKTIGLNVTKATTDVSVGAQLSFSVTVGGDTLNLDGGLTVTTGGSNNVTIWGALEGQDGAWKNPFGLSGVTINSLGVELGVSAVFPFLVVGLRGEVHIGNGLLGGEVAILFDASDIAKCILSIYSEEGLNLPKIISALTSGKVDVSKILNISLTQFQLYLAPNGGTIAGKSYDPGFAVGGHLNLWGFNASIEGHLDPSSGGSLKGTLDPVHLKANGTSYLDITAVDGKSGAAMQVDASTSAVGGSIDAQVTLLGSLKASTKMTLNSSGFTASLSASALGIYSSTSLTMEKGLFKLSSQTSFGASVSISGVNVSVTVSAGIYIEVNSSSFSQSVSFSFGAMGKTFNAGPYGVTIPFSQVADLVQVFTDKVKNLFTNTISGYLGEGTAAAFNWIKGSVNNDARAVATVMKGVGNSSATVARGLVNYCSTTAEQAVSYMNLGADEAADILKNTFNESADQVGSYLTDVRGFSEDTAKAAMGAAGYGANEIGDFFQDNLNPSHW